MSASQRGYSRGLFADFSKVLRDFFIGTLRGFTVQQSRRITNPGRRLALIQYRARLVKGGALIHFFQLV